jgi:hypothetical protein
MFCGSCGHQNPDAGKFCHACGRPFAEKPVSQFAAPSPHLLVQDPPKRKRSTLKTVGIIFVALFVVTLVLNWITGSGPGTSQKQAAGLSSRPTVAPANFRIYRQELGFPVVVVVARDASDDRVKSLLWLFREKVRERRFAELGLNKPTSAKSSSGSYDFKSGMIEVFRGEKYANEPFTKNGPTQHPADAAYQWGIDRDPDKDDTVLKGPNGSGIKVFDASDNWQIPKEEQQRVEAVKKAAERCTANDPMVTMPARMVLSGWEGGSSTAQYWIGKVERKRLFTVKNFDLLDRYYVPDKTSLTGVKPNSAALKFRIESSTQGGFPITKDWYVDVTLAGDTCAVYNVREAD